MGYCRGKPIILEHSVTLVSIFYKEDGESQLIQ